jgi:soluble lytic murein transglycosylase-like protein
MATPRDLQLALKAKRFGMQNSLRIVLEARAAGVPISLAFAMVEQESGNGANIFGHDDTIFAGAGKVTREKYLRYRQERGKTRMQGVGPMQLTWYELQDDADRLGGCWIPKYNIRVGFRHLAQLIKQYGHDLGVERYNGSGPAAVEYRRSVLAREKKWHDRLT